MSGPWEPTLPSVTRHDSQSVRCAVSRTHFPRIRIGVHGHADDVDHPSDVGLRHILALFLCFPLMSLPLERRDEGQASTLELARELGVEVGRQE